MADTVAPTSIGPVLLESAGDAYTDGARINTIIWDGATSQGDRVVLRHRNGGELLWQARTDITNTYLGANFGESGIHAPEGFHVDRLDAGVLLIYLREG